MATASDILAKKGFSVIVVPSTATVLDAVERMNQLRIGAVVVMDDGHVCGMFTERDVLQRVVGTRRDPETTTVESVMTADVICCKPDTDVDDISGIMKNKRVRHLPVCDEEGDMLGMISIGDVNAMHASSKEAELHYLTSYMYGRG